LLSAAAWYKT